MNILEQPEELSSKQNLLQELEILAASHDWNYADSDDHSIWKKGFNRQCKIDLIVAQCKEQELYKEAIDIMSKYWNA